MIRSSTDPAGLSVPTVDPGAAWDAAAGLTSVARSAQAAADALAAAPTAAVCWSGPAAEAYRGVRERLAGRSVEVASVAAAAAAVVLDWVRDAAPAVAAMRSGAGRVAEVHRRLDLAAAAGGQDPAVVAALHAELTAGYGQWSGGRQAYADAVRAAASRLMGLPDGISDRPLGLADHAAAAARTAWDGGVVAPAAAVWAVTGQAVTDPGGWWRTLTSAPGAVVDGIAAAVMDPRGTAAALVDADAWADGRYGEAAAAAAVGFLPGPRWLHAVPDAGPTRFARNIADPAAPRPVPQGVEEMLTDGVDLDRHEHAHLGHALRRHVDVDDDYLMDRLTHGTLLDQAKRGGIPPEASRFTDRATAERVVSDALRDHQLELRDLTHQPVGSSMQIEFPTRDPIGEVMTRAPGGFTVREARHLAVTVKVGPDGPFIYTAFVR